VPSGLGRAVVIMAGISGGVVDIATHSQLGARTPCQPCHRMGGPLVASERVRYMPNLSRSVAQPGRALCSGRRGRRFKSSHSDQKFHSKFNRFRRLGPPITATHFYMRECCDGARGDPLHLGWALSQEGDNE
jgi:hypothetical protein